MKTNRHKRVRIADVDWGQYCVTGIINNRRVQITVKAAMQADPEWTKKYLKELGYEE